MARENEAFVIKYQRGKGSPIQEVVVPIGTQQEKINEITSQGNRIVSTFFGNYASPQGYGNVTQTEQQLQMSLPANLRNLSPEETIRTQSTPTEITLRQSLPENLRNLPVEQVNQRQSPLTGIFIQNEQGQRRQVGSSNQLIITQEQKQEQTSPFNSFLSNVENPFSKVEQKLLLKQEQANRQGGQSLLDFEVTQTGLFGIGFYKGSVGFLSTAIKDPFGTIYGVGKGYYKLATQPKQTIKRIVKLADVNPAGFFGEAVGNTFLFKGVGKVVKKIPNPFETAKFVEVENIGKKGIIENINKPTKEFKFVEGMTTPRSYSYLKTFEKDIIPTAHVTIEPKFSRFKQGEIILEQPKGGGVKGYREEAGALGFYQSVPEKIGKELQRTAYLGYADIGADYSAGVKIIFSLRTTRRKAFLLEPYISETPKNLINNLNQKELTLFQMGQSGKTFIPAQNIPNLRNKIFGSVEGQVYTSAKNIKTGAIGSKLRLTSEEYYTFYKQPKKAPFGFLEGLYETKLFKGLGISEKRTKIYFQYGEILPIGEEIGKVSNKKIKSLNLEEYYKNYGRTKNIAVSDLISDISPNINIFSSSSKVLGKEFEIYSEVSSRPSKSSSVNSIFSSLSSTPSINSFLSIPSIPSVPSVPSVPSKPSKPSIPSLPSIPSILSIPSIPSVPSVPSVPSKPSKPYFPKAPLFFPPQPRIIRIGKEPKEKYKRGFTYFPDIEAVFEDKGIKEPRGKKVFYGFERRPRTIKELRISPIRDISINIFKESKVPFEIQRPTRKQIRKQKSRRKLITNLFDNMADIDLGKL